MDYLDKIVNESVNIINKTYNLQESRYNENYRLLNDFHSDIEKFVDNIVQGGQSRDIRNLVQHTNYKYDELYEKIGNKLYSKSQDREYKKLVNFYKKIRNILYGRNVLNKVRSIPSMASAIEYAVIDYRM
jgi:uncharacterized protein Yka (UPF0111/DUF47 family)